MKLRVSLTQQGEDIKGVVELPGDPAFILEALYLIIERFAYQANSAQMKSSRTCGVFIK